MQALAASCEELRARTGKPPLESEIVIGQQGFRHNAHGCS